jgi:hypothetical protein
VRWPSPEDCLPHNPATVSIRHDTTQNIWQVVDGSHYLLAFDSEANAEKGLALAQRYRTECFIGRSNTRTNRYQYIFEYWKDPSGLTATVPNPDCIPYNPGNLTVENLGATGWRIDDGPSWLVLFDTQQDANNGLLVMRMSTHICYIGRDNSGPNRYQQMTTYLA